MRNLKILYEILWVEIKDKPRVYSLQREANVLFVNDEISKDEYNELNESLYKEWKGFMLLSNTKNRKHFVKKMIHKLAVCPWINIKDNRPENGEEVLCFNKNWIDEDFNPNGIRVGFLNGENEFTTAYWWDYQDTYMTISKDECEGSELYSEEIKNNTDPTHWMHFPEVPKK